MRCADSPDTWAYRRSPGLLAAALVATLVACSDQPPAFEYGPVDYEAWEEVLYSLPISAEDGIGTWSTSAEGAVQSTNADPSMLVSDRTIDAQAIEGTWLVDGGGDDDWIGFVFGFQDPGHTYVFDWRRNEQSDALEGMSIKRLDAPYDGPTTGTLPVGVPAIGDEADDGWAWLGLPDGSVVVELHHDGAPGGWLVGHEYEFRLEQRRSTYRIVIQEQGEVLFDYEFSDGAYPVGRFGFYNYSQPGVTYRGFTIVPIPGRSRWIVILLLAAPVSILILLSGARLIQQKQKKETAAEQSVGEEQPDSQGPLILLVANEHPGHMELHRKTCRYAAQIHESNRRVITGSAAQVDALYQRNELPEETIDRLAQEGFDGCHYCLPSRHWK